MGEMSQQEEAARVAASLETIKSHMPQTYAEIQAQARAHGNVVFGDVRAGLRGVPDRFYAIEAGRVMGTPFSRQDVTAELALLMVQFGVSHLVVWPVRDGAQGFTTTGVAR